jgi:N-carbamoylputrescine amidase
LALEGIDALFLPHASPRGTPREKAASWRRHLPARAFDNGIFVVAVNQAGENGAGLAFPGLAVALGPDGRVLAEMDDGREGLLVVDLDLESLAAVRRHPLRYFLTQRRPEVYR